MNYQLRPVQVEGGDIVESPRRLAPRRQHAEVVEIDIERLAAVMKDQELRDLQERVERAEAAAAKATAHEEAAKTYKAQLDDALRSLAEARAELKARDERRQVTDVAEMAAIANRTPGWSARRTDGNGHWQFLKDGKAVGLGSGTASDHRSAKNLRSYLRKAGLNV